MATVSIRTIVRGDNGRFKAACLGAATKVVEDCLDAGIEAAKAAAPVGHKPDMRSTPIIASFYDEVLSRTSGRFGNFARHAMYQDQGTGPHEITGDVTFFWEREGRMWEPGDNMIQHPGNPATHFMEEGINGMRAAAMPSMHRHYPG